MKQVTITNETENQRLDKFLLKYLNTATKSFVYKMLRKKNIKLNDKRCEGNEILSNGDVVTLYLSDDTLDKFMCEKTIASAKPINIIFEDDNIIVMNKPSGLLSHDDNDSDSLNHRMLYYLQQTNQFDTSKQSTFTPSICNRLDRNTSGIVTGAKNLKTSVSLNTIFKNNEVNRYYLALVCGNVKEKITIKTRFNKDTENNVSKISYNEDDKEITTIFEPLTNFEDYTLVKVKLLTGKSHQIRLHLSSKGFYIVGDYKYGNIEVNNIFKHKYNLTSQFLHCNQITIKDTEGYLDYLNNKTFECNLPSNLQKIVNSLK